MWFPAAGLSFFFMGPPFDRLHCVTHFSPTRLKITRRGKSRWTIGRKERSISRGECRASATFTCNFQTTRARSSRMYVTARVQRSAEDEVSASDERVENVRDAAALKRRVDTECSHSNIRRSTYCSLTGRTSRTRKSRYGESERKGGKERESIPACP